ncbi:putative RNA-directed DNA polymerase, eukaryota, reverse transcriptase zinc-binding domain protein [Tanacetum coccineum]
MGSMRSKEDEVLKIATSVFVTSFPDHFIAKDLWNTCEAYKDKEVKGYSNSYANVLRGSQPMNMEMENNPALVLDNSCLNHQDYSNFLIGKVKDFASLSNLKQASNDFIIDGRVTWVEIEGIPLKMWSANTFARIASKWGTLIHVDDQENGCLYMKIVCINTNVTSNIFESFKVIYKGKVFWVRAKEIPGWVPDFVEDNDEETNTDEETNEGESNGEDVGLKKFSTWEGDSDEEAVPDTKFEEEIPKTNVEEVSVRQKDVHSVDPFNLYDLLNKKQDDNNKGHNVDDSLKYPPGYTPIDKKDATDEHSNKSNESKRASGERFQITHEEEGVFGAKKSCLKNISKEDVAESICSGHFQKAEIPRSGGSILQLMDDLVKGADAFNLFISNASLEEVPLGVFSFTWCHKSATKMSKLDRFLISESLMSACPNISAITLDRYLSDHRPILMRESHYDYGPVPFRFFHYWFEMESFDKFVEESWKEAPVAETNALIKMMKKLKYMKEKIRVWNKKKKEYPNNSKQNLKAELDSVIDKGEGDDDVVNKRTNIVRSLQELEKFQSLETAQKAKIKWAIEGDENSNLVKSEFLSHFKNRFDQPQETRLHLDMNFPNNLNSDQQADLECEVTKKEIKRAVWDCGIDKSPGPDGFTFGFYRRYWKILESDMVDAVTCFFQQGNFPKGGNSSFITLFPKTPNANMVKDFRPISLIRSMYKIIAKILANRLVVVLGNLVNEVQSAFVADKKILDGPFILNELLQWCKSKKKHSLVFKVDFEKAYDSVRWDYLDDILRKFGFGENWFCMSRFKVWWMLWSESNISTIVHVLDCFHRASGLRINMSKSKLMGISVDVDKVDQATRKIGCVTLKTPFIYLGSKVGGLMSRVQS